MSEQSQKPSYLRLTSSQLASPAKGQALPEADEDLQMTEPLFGGRLSESLACFDPSASCWRTFQACLPFAGAETLARFSDPWPASGTMQNGKLYQRRQSELPSAETGFLSSQLFPTPTTAPTRPCEGNVRIYRKMVQIGQMDMSTACTLLNGKNPFTSQGSIPAIPDHPVCPPTGKELAPKFLEWLMGFPVGWTAIDASEMLLCHSAPNGSEDE